ncbi:hypothetical protein MTO96_041212, partial [Rhipicephalus appendiculatus]
MTISVLTEEPFNGILHTRDTSDPRGIVKELRRGPCIAYGTGGRNTSLRISLFPEQDDPLYCGVRRKQGTEERSVAISIRKCQERAVQGFPLGFLEEQKRVHELVMGHHYTLRASAHGPGETGGIVVRSCFSFASNTSEEELIDANG